MVDPRRSYCPQIGTSVTGWKSLGSTQNRGKTLDTHSMAVVQPAAQPEVAGGLQPATCLGRTCLKWTPDGELSAQDVQLILQRLGQVDAQIGVG